METVPIKTSVMAKEAGKDQKGVLYYFFYGRLDPIQKRITLCGWFAVGLRLVCGIFAVRDRLATV